jgi:hypothetical protein
MIRSKWALFGRNGRLWSTMGPVWSEWEVVVDLLLHG